jgi:hypothetical protein
MFEEVEKQEDILTIGLVGNGKKKEFKVRPKMISIFGLS